MAEAALSKQKLREYAGLGALYFVFFCTAFVFAAYLTFPYDRLRDYILTKLEASTRGRTDGLDVDIGELEPSMLTGVVLRDIDLKKRTSDPEAEVSALHFDEVTARVSVWSLVTRAPKINFKAKVGEGEIEGSYERDGDAMEIEADLDALDIGKLGLGGFLGVPMKGRATGRLTLELPAEAPKAAGELQLKIAGLRIGDGKAKVALPSLRTGMTLDEIDAGSLSLAIKAQNGSAEIVKLKTDGKDLAIQGEGSIRLANPLRRSRPDVQLALKLSDAYKTKTDRTKALFDILSMQPDVQRALGPDGAINLHVAGTLQSPRATPGGQLGAKKR